MKRRAATGLLGAALCLGLAAPATAEEPVIEDVLAILKERGIIDEDQHTSLVSKNQTYEEEHGSLLGRIEWSGDFRFRSEHFWYDRDVFDVNRSNRTRLRYRLRLHGRAAVNDYIDAHFTIGTGNENRSGNQTLGSGNDFDPDGIFIRRAYLEIQPYRDEWMPEGAGLKLYTGKVPNPFLWKNGKDYLLWDHDIDPEGVAVKAQVAVTEWVDLYANAGYFIIDENSTRQDPHVLGIQVGADYDPDGPFSLGGRFSWYSWSSLDAAFINRNVAFGNVVDGLTGDTAPVMGVATEADDQLQAGEFAAWARYDGIEDWPILVYGHYLRNFDGRHSVAVPGADEEDSAWNVGVEVGDKKKYVTLGAGYYVMEANAWPAVFIDSDFTDGFTNRRGYTLYGVRQILPNTDLALEAFVSDDVDSEPTAFPVSLANSERIRFRADLKVKF